MDLKLKDDLPYTSVTVLHQGRTLEISDVLVDTGSAGTLFSVDVLAELGIQPELDDVLHTVRGIGGSEVVFARRLEKLSVGDSGVNNFEVEIGAMDYGFELQGILGMDFLMRIGAIINLRQMSLDFETE